MSKDRVYTPGANVPLIWDAGMTIFRDHVFKSPIKEHIIDAILTQIEIERDDHTINRSAVKSCVDVFLQLHIGDGSETVYKNVLEPEILEASKKYYFAEGERLVSACDAPEFLRRVRRPISKYMHAIHFWILRKGRRALQCRGFTCTQLPFITDSSASTTNTRGCAPISSPQRRFIDA